MTETKRSTLRLRRIVWKRPPTDQEIGEIVIATLFGPSVFRRENEWLFIRGNTPGLHAPTPLGFERVDLTGEAEI